MKQTAVALSTTEAEYVALAETVREIIWLRRILLKLGFPQMDPTVVKEDNQACISWVTGDASSERSKHIELKNHYSKDMSEKKEVTFKYCPTDKMLADILTKPLGGNKFEELRSAIGVLNAESMSGKSCETSPAVPS